MPEPARLPARHVDLDRLEAEPLREHLRREAVSPRVLTRHAVHHTDALRMEALEPPMAVLELLKYVNSRWETGAERQKIW